jgi:Cof subfamily protein (haloacid dehalogenase superfamily)
MLKEKEETGLTRSKWAPELAGFFSGEELPLFLPEFLLMDLDGTFLDPEKKISQKTSQILQEFWQSPEANRFRLGICTGRSYANLVNSVLPIFREKRPNDLHIICGGGAIIDSLGNTLVERTMGSDLVKALARGAAERGAAFGFGQGEVFYCDPKMKAHREESFPDVKYALAEELSSWSTSLLVISGLNPEVDAFIENFDQNGEIVAERMTGYAGRSYYDITSAGVDKRSAMKKLAEIVNVPEKKIAAIGDNFNDLELIEGLPWGIAMANAKEEVQKAASLTLNYSNAEDGVARLIQALQKAYRLQSLLETEREK